MIRFSQFTVDLKYDKYVIAAIENDIYYIDGVELAEFNKWFASNASQLQNWKCLRECRACDALLGRSYSLIKQHFSLHILIVDQTIAALSR